MNTTSDQLITAVTPIDSSVDSVMIQFSLSKSKLIPDQALTLDDEGLLGYAGRMLETEDAPGVQIIMQDHRRAVSLERLVMELLMQDFALVGLSTQERRDRKDVDKTFHMVRATFRRDADQALPATSLAVLTQHSFWHIRAYLNPRDGGDLVSINCDARIQRFLQDNPAQPVEIYQRIDGRKTDRKLALVPDYYLVASDGMLALEPHTV